MRFNKLLLAKNVKKISTEKSIKISQIEKDIGVSQGYISRLANEDNKAEFPIVELLLYLNEHYNISVTALLTTDMEKMSATDQYLYNFIDKLIADTQNEILGWNVESWQQLNFDAEYREGHPLFLSWCDFTPTTEKKYMSNYGSRSLCDDLYHTVIGTKALFLAFVSDNDTEDLYYEMYFSEQKNYSMVSAVCEIKEGSVLWNIADTLYTLANQSSKKVRFDNEIKPIIDAYMGGKF